MSGWSDTVLASQLAKALAIMVEEGSGGFAKFSFEELSDAYPMAVSAWWEDGYLVVEALRLDDDAS